MLHDENLLKIKSLITQLENENKQSKINKIGDEYKPIADYYANESIVAQNGKLVQKFTLPGTQNSLAHINLGEPLIHNKDTLLRNLKILEMHIRSKCEGDNSFSKYGVQNANTTYNIYGNNNVINNGNICLEIIKKIESMNLDNNEKDEIKNQIELIKTILESKDTKEKKWSKLKNIGKWIFDKSVDVGLALLPLFLNIH